MSFSEVEGMYCKDEGALAGCGHSINSSGAWRVKHVWKTVPETLLVPKARGGDGKSKEEQFWVRARDRDRACVPREYSS